MLDRPSPAQFEGCLIGLAVGDALGAPYEGLAEDYIFEVGPASKIVANPPHKTLRYTDDTQMAIGVAECLIADGEIHEASLVKSFAQNYDPMRGYGSGARQILEAVRDGSNWRELAANLFPGGSLGNGAAMRVAPIGMIFSDDLNQVAEQAERSASPTHLHPIGIEGARLLALAVALAAREISFHRTHFFEELFTYAATEEFQWQLTTAAKLRRTDSLSTFGNGLEAHRSVTTAIAAFAASPDDYPRVIARAISQGGDTDTLAAMAGAICGAHMGIDAIPSHLIEKLEDKHKGRSYLTALAAQLYDRHQSRTRKDANGRGRSPQSEPPAGGGAATRPYPSHPT